MDSSQFPEPETSNSDPTSISSSSAVGEHHPGARLRAATRTKNGATGTPSASTSATTARRSPSAAAAGPTCSNSSDTSISSAWGSLDALVGRLRAAYEENGGKPETNPFGARAVRLYLREVRDLQSKARGVSYEKKKRKRPPPTAAAEAADQPPSSSGEG
ncbi:hypothetical protein DH2020_020772 [Rehmannia glutinosa]|uniref:ALOG domain-containing protein n=1 Tax=Rehmannia glutinosa TaxID=99300 RepID=A0ABR0WCC4_REHGL